MRRFSRMAALLTAAAFAGCAAAPMPMQAGRPLLSPAELQRYYRYTPVDLAPTLNSAEPGDGCQIERITLSAPVNANLPPIRLDWYKPEGKGRHPAVLMSPILAGNDLYVREFARFYAARGLHAVLVYRKKEVFSSNRPLSDIEDHLRDSVIQLRRVLDWLEKQDSVDSGKIGSFAISMGALLTTILAAVDPRIRCSVLGLPACHIPEILMTSQDKGIRKRRENYLKEKGVTKEQLLAQLRAVIRSEPLAAAPAIPRKKMLIIAGLFDRVLGFGRSLELWRAMGRPELIVLPTGHYTAYAVTPYLKRVTYSFLRRQLR